MATRHSIETAVTSGDPHDSLGLARELRQGGNAFKALMASLSVAASQHFEAADDELYESGMNCVDYAELTGLVDRALQANYAASPGQRTGFLRALTLWLELTSDGVPDKWDPIEDTAASFAQAAPEVRLS